MLAVLLLVIAGSGCINYGPPGTPKEIPRALTFMISSNTVSNFTPCGCHSGKWGGMPRRGTIFNNVKEKIDWPMLQVDTGDVTQGSTSEMQKLKDMYIFQAFEVMNYDIVNVGVNELALGYEELNRIENENNIPWISANTHAPGAFPDLNVTAPQIDDRKPLETPSSGEEEPVADGNERENPDDIDRSAYEDLPVPLFQPYKIVEPEGAPGYKVGFIGMMIQDAGRLNPRKEDFSFEPYEVTIPRTVDILRNIEKVDLVVLICDADNLQNVDESLFADIDIVIGGRQNLVRSPNAALNPLNPHYRPGLNQQGQLSTAGQTPDSNTSPNGETGESEEEELILDPINTPLIVSKGQGRGRLVRRFDITLDHSGRIVDYFTEEIRVDDTNIDDPRMAEVARGYDSDVLVVELMGRVERSYAGSETCAECHPGYLEAWADHGHFHTYERIVNEDALDDRECTRCHAIGFNEEPRLLTYDLIKESHRNVGCEACHQNGKRHITLQRQLAGLSDEARANATTTDAMSTDITAGTCTHCHNGEHGDGFNFSEAMAAARAICQSIDPHFVMPDDSN